jgi:AcrR family transcriptional regulator
VGLREDKKEQARRQIAETAWRLFADRGFERVTVAEVADQARVAKATVFNYFPTKEDLLFSRLEAYGQRLVEAVAARPAGETALAAFRRNLLDTGGLLGQAEAGDAHAMERLRTFHRVIAASQALQAREHQALAATAGALAALLAAETGAAAGDPAPQVAANALVGVQRALVGETRRLAIADGDPVAIAAAVRSFGERAFAVLERGLGDYAPGAGASALPTRNQVSSSPLPLTSTGPRRSKR